ncbi:unnamed protein product [Durusdinium trenchii]|uniref:Uncharacterized protein n=2 Tax=Durusdinium trenchii TaxID=1381693 RepID=A0ABP0HPR4_9DINO
MSGAKVDLSGGASAPPPTHGYGGYGGGGVAQPMVEAAMQDPTVQQHIKEVAYQQASAGYEAAKVAGAMAAEELGKYIQEGPAGISVLCFLGGMATTLIGLLGLLNFGNGFTSPFQYVLNAYLMVFGIVTFLLEADVESLRSMKVLGRLSPWVERYQLEVFNRANFLTELRGRGFFYVFIGTLAVTQCFICLTFVAGLWNLLMGILCLLMSFGISPASHLQTQGQPGQP